MAGPTIRSLSYEQLLHEEVARYYNDPNGWVAAMYPWQEAGTALELEPGPDQWQRDFLIWLGQEVTARGFDGVTAVPAIRAAVSKGHGVGGSALAAWLVNWIMSTRPHCQGTITANTITQLQTKTWAAVQRWTQLCKTGHWFEINADRMYRVGYRASWFCAPQSSKEENSESFAGQHAKNSSSFYINDEDCYASDTEVLTQRGWTAFSTLTPADSCVTMDPATGLAEYQPVIAVHWAHRRGPMITHRSKTASWCVTPHHRMWTRRRRPRSKTYGPWSWHTADQLVKTDEMSRYIDWGAPDVESFTIPGFTSDRKTYPARTVAMDTWVQWLGWYFSEGNLVHRQNRFGQREYTGVGISNRDVSAVQALSADLGLQGVVYPATKTVSNLRFHDRALAEYLAAFGPTCLTRSLPAFLRDLSARQIRLFLDAYVQGDGYRKTRGLEILYTSSKALADGLHELCLKSGAGSSLTVRPLKGVRSQIEGRTVTSSTDGYVITRSSERRALTAKHPGGIRTIPYDGLIYCASLPKHHLLFTRRDGVCVWSGNSGVPEVIHTIEEGGLTDGEPMQFLFGNCTRSSGSFYQACFGKLRHRYHVVVVDSRTSRFTNKAQIAEWAADYGEDSDFFRVRVLGLPPNASDAQFIDQERVSAAQKRDVIVLPDEPLIAGCDLAWGGNDFNCVRFRRGRDARSIPAIRIPGEATRDPSVLTTRLADILGSTYDGHRVRMLFLDSAGIAGAIGTRLRELGHRNILEVNFGADSPNPKCRYMRDFMWQSLKEWLLTGAIDRHPGLEGDLLGPGLRPDRQQRVWLESKEDMKKRGIHSPDDADALALTFAQKVTPKRTTLHLAPRPGTSSELGWLA